MISKPSPSKQWILLAALILCTLPTRAMAQVFADSAPPKSSAAVPLDTSAVVRERYVTVNLDELPDPAADASARDKQVVALKLFDDVTVNVTPVRVEDGYEAGQVVWKGQSEGFFPGSTTLVSMDGVTIGTVRTADLKVYEVRYAGDGVHVIREIDGSLFPDEGDPIAISLPDGVKAQAKAALAKNTGTADDINDALFQDESQPIVPPLPAGTKASTKTTDKAGETTVDVMIVYTPAAVTEAGGSTAMSNLITNGISDANDAFTNSGVEIEFRLVYSGQVNYTEESGTAGFSAALSALKDDDDGQMDWIHTTRESKGADIVSLWSDNDGYCGLGYLMGRSYITGSYDFSGSAFNVVNQSCVTNYTFAHESGHNMGSTHDLDNATSDPAYTYSYGYQQTTASTPYRTIMAYACDNVTCNRVGYWSNPDVNYLSKPTGTATADNVQSLNNLKSTIAGWTDTASVPTLNEWGVILLSLLLACGAVWWMRRRTA